MSLNLQVKLLLIHGELDDNVLPAQTLPRGDALVRADEDVVSPHSRRPRAV